MSIEPDKPLFFQQWRSKLLILLIILVGLLFPFFELKEGGVKADFWGNVLLLEKEPEETPLILQENSVLNPSPISPSLEEPKRTLVIVTGYSSTPDQTDEDPWITASGRPVREGVIAANFLPFGTKVRLPALYGEKTFVVEDRMHPRMGYQIDIWFPSRWQALDFGAKTTYIEILES